MSVTRLEFLHQLRNARWQHLIFLKKESEREDRCLDIVIDWAKDALIKADRALARESLKWTQQMLNDPEFEDEHEEDKQSIIDDNNFYTSWLM